ncbi:MAG: TolC family protein [Pseudomonadota bacterium]
MMVTLLTLASGAGAEDLLDVYRLAEKADPQVRAVEAAWQAVQEARNQSLAQFRPQISLSSNLTRNRQEFLSGGFLGFSLEGQTFYSRNTGVTLDLNQPLYHRDYYVQLHLADARIRQAEADYNAARQALLQRVAEQYFNVLSASTPLSLCAPRKRR